MPDDIPTPAPVEPQPQEAATPSEQVGSPVLAAHSSGRSLAIDDSTGDIYSVGPGSKANAAILGLRPIDSNEATTALVNKKYGTAQQQLLAAPEQFASGLTGGLSELAEKKLGVSPAGILGRQQANPVENFIAQGAGMGTAFAGTGGLGELFGLGEGTVGAALARGAVQQGLWGGSQEYVDQVLNDQPFNGEAVAEALGINGLLGAGAEAGLFGLGKAVNSAALTNSVSNAGQIAGDLYRRASSLVTGESLETLEELSAKAAQASEAGGFSPLFDKAFGDASTSATDTLSSMESEGKNLAREVRSSILNDAKAKLAGLPDVTKTAAESELAGMQQTLNEHLAGVGPGEEIAAESRTANPNHASKITKPAQEAINFASEKLGDAKSASDVWETMDKLRAQLQDLGHYQAAEGELSKPVYESTSVARDLAQRAGSFVKSEEMFPGVGARWAEWQAAHSGFLEAFNTLRGTAGATQAGERVLAKQKIGSLLREIYKDPTHFGAGVVDDAVSAARNLAEAADKVGPSLTPNNYIPRIPGVTAQAEKLANARLAAEKSLTSKAAAARLGGATGGLSLRGGLSAFVAHRALGIGYGTALLPVLGYQALAHPAAASLTRARLASLVGRLSARIDLGAAKSVASLLASGISRGAVAETVRGLADAAKEHVLTDHITTKRHPTWEAGAQAHAGFVNQPGDLPARLSESLGQLDDEDKGTATVSLGNHLAYLQSVSPKSTSIGTADSVPPPRADLLKYAQTVYSVRHPVETLNAQLAAGVPDPDQIAAVEATSPGILTRYRSAVAQEVAHNWPKEGTVPIRVQSSIAKLFGGDLDSGQYGLAIQAAVTPPQNAQPPPNLGSKPKNDKKLAIRQDVRLPYHTQES